jgi:hypothetical protein
MLKVKCCTGTIQRTSGTALTAGFATLIEYKTGLLRPGLDLIVSSETKLAVGGMREPPNIYVRVRTVTTCVLVGQKDLVHEIKEPAR